MLKLDRHAGGLSRAIAHAEALLDLPRSRRLAVSRDRGQPPRCRPDLPARHHGLPPACIPTCLYLLMTTDSFEEALTEVVNLGGDTDTAGAILGALAGAYYGVDAIPDRWLDGLQNREGIDAWAIALAQRSRRGIPHPGLDRHRAISHPQGRREFRVVRLGHASGGDRDAGPPPLSTESHGAALVAIASRVPRCDLRKCASLGSKSIACVTLSPTVIFR